MSKIYVGQSNLRISVSTGADITGHTTVTLEIKKPAGSATSWTCTVDDASTGAIYYDIPTSTTLDVAGTYLIQAKVVYTASAVSYGETISLKVWPLFS